MSAVDGHVLDDQICLSTVGFDAKLTAGPVLCVAVRADDREVLDSCCVCFYAIACVLGQKLDCASLTAFGLVVDVVVGQVRKRLAVAVKRDAGRQRELRFGDGVRRHGDGVARGCLGQRFFKAVDRAVCLAVVRELCRADGRLERDVCVTRAVVRRDTQRHACAVVLKKPCCEVFCDCGNQRVSLGRSVFYDPVRALEVGGADPDVFGVAVLDGFNARAAVKAIQRAQEACHIVHDTRAVGGCLSRRETAQERGAVCKEGAVVGVGRSGCRVIVCQRARDALCCALWRDDRAAAPPGALDCKSRDGSHRGKGRCQRCRQRDL